MATKENILKTAHKLFNKAGIDKITTRHIATEMGISHGNLQYHYKNTDVIIEALFNQLIDAFNEIVNKLSSDKAAPMSSVWTIFMHQSFPLIYEYRFIFLEFVAITRRLPSIKKTYFKLVKERKEQYNAVIDYCIEAGEFRQDIPRKQYNYALEQLFIIVDFWLSSNEITQQLKGKKATDYYTQVFLSVFYPYLTEKGMKQFKAAGAYTNLKIE